MLKRQITMIVLAAGITAGIPSFAGVRIDTDLRIELNHADGVYAAGDTVIVSAIPIGDYDKSLEMTVYENGIRLLTTPVGRVDAPRTLYTDRRGKPVAVMLEFRPEGTTPREHYFNVDQSEDAFRIGYVVAPDGFEPGFKAPSDLHRYWDSQIRKLRRRPMEAQVRPVVLDDDTARHTECYEVTVSSIDSIPVRGYVAKPRDAAPSTLPILIKFHSAGVAGLWCRAKAGDAVALSEMGAIVFDFNAHGMLNDADEEYYRELENGRLLDYSGRPLESREDYYFRTMILRAVRGLDYITQDPAWDGERVMVMGGSQGGAQSVALAGIDSRVTDVVVTVPAMVGNGGALLGRNDAWPWPLEHSGIQTPTSPYMDSQEFPATARSAKRVLEIAPYFDCALLARGCKASFFVEIGLVDTCCPPSEVFSGINVITGPVQVVTCPYRNHWEARVPEQYKDWWRTNVNDPRLKYIEQHLGAKR